MAKQRKVKKIEVKNSIYDGTILEGMPFRFKWHRKRPEITYEVTDKDITVFSYKSWMNIEEKNTLTELRHMFLHDMCHALLYMDRDEKDKVFTNDFGLSWDSSTKTEPVNFFKSYAELLDEMKIVALSYILGDKVDQKPIQPKKYYIDHIVDITKNVQLYGEDLADKYTAVRKRSMVASAVAYWFKDEKIAKLPVLIQKLKDTVNERYEKASV